MAKRKYQDVEDLLKENPDMSPAEAGRQLGYTEELHWKSKSQGRVGPKHRHSDGVRKQAEALQRGSAPRQVPPLKPGFDRHHKRMIMLYKPLFDGLSETEALKLSEYAASQGLDLGDVEKNYQYLDKISHNEIHRYMEREGMRPRDMPDFSNMDLKNRKKTFDVLYRDFIQPDIDKKTNRLIDQVGLTPAQRRQISRMSLEEQDSFITQLKKTRKSTKNLPGVSLMVGGGLAAAQLLQGKPASAAETAFDTAVSEIPIVGDVLEPAPTADATLQGRTDPQAYAAQYKQERQKAKEEQSNFITDTLKLISDAL